MRTLDLVEDDEQGHNGGHGHRGQLVLQQLLSVLHRGEGQLVHAVGDGGDGPPPQDDALPLLLQLLSLRLGEGAGAPASGGGRAAVAAVRGVVGGDAVAVADVAGPAAGAAAAAVLSEEMSEPPLCDEEALLTMTGFEFLAGVEEDDSMRRSI